MKKKHQETLVAYRKLTPEERNKEIPKHIIDAISLMRPRADQTTAPFHYNSIGKMLREGASGAVIPSAQDIIASSEETAEPLPENEDLAKLRKISKITSQIELERPEPIKLANFEEVIGQAAAKIARDVDANCVVSIEKKENGQESPTTIDVKVVVFKRLKKSHHKVEYHTTMKRLMSGSVIPIKELLMEAINKKYIAKDDRVVCVSDESVGSGYKGLLFIFDVDKVFFNMSMHHLTEKISPEVLETVINLAIEIGQEGREGKHIGTAFIIGEPEKLSPHVRQLIINPFAGVPENQRKITDAMLRETVKGFAQLDGVFVISPEGALTSAGTHINIDLGAVDLNHLQGFGTRHRYCAGITKMTDAVAVVVSESGGTVRIIKDGQIVMRLP